MRKHKAVSTVRSATAKPIRSSAASTTSGPNSRSNGTKTPNTPSSRSTPSDKTELTNDLPVIVDDDNDDNYTDVDEDEDEDEDSVDDEFRIGLEEHDDEEIVIAETDDETLQRPPKKRRLSKGKVVAKQGSQPKYKDSVTRKNFARSSGQVTVVKKKKKVMKRVSRSGPAASERMRKAWRTRKLLYGRQGVKPETAQAMAEGGELF